MKMRISFMILAMASLSLASCASRPEMERPSAFEAIVAQIPASHWIKGKWIAKPGGKTPVGSTIFASLELDGKTLTRHPVHGADAETLRYEITAESESRMTLVTLNADNTAGQTWEFTLYRNQEEIDIQGIGIFNRQKRSEFTPEMSVPAPESSSAPDAGS